MPAQWSIQAHDGPPGLLRLESDWLALLAEMPGHGPQHHFETQRAYVQHLSPSDSGYACLALSDGSRIRAICPLERGVVTVLGREFTVLGLPWQMLDLCPDLICPEGEAESRLLPAVLEWLRRAPKRPRWLVLDRVSEGSAAARCLAQLSATRQCATPLEPSAVFDGSLSDQAFEARLAPPFRTNLRTAARRLAAMGEARFVSVSDAAGAAQAYADFLAVESSGWKGEAGLRGAVRFKPEQAAFYRSLVERAGQGSGCEFNALYLNGQCIASQLCLRGGGGELAIPKLGYDERFSRASPGQLLFAWALQRCRAEPGVRRVNMVSNARWFHPWRPAYEQNRRVLIGVGRFSGPLLATLMRWGSSGVRWIRRHRPASRANPGAPD